MYIHSESPFIPPKIRHSFIPPTVERSKLFTEEKVRSNWPGRFFVGDTNGRYSHGSLVLYPWCSWDRLNPLTKLGVFLWPICGKFPGLIQGKMLQEAPLLCCQNIGKSCKFFQHHSTVLKNGDKANQFCYSLRSGEWGIYHGLGLRENQRAKLFYFGLNPWFSWCLL